MDEFRALWESNRTAKESSFQRRQCPATSIGWENDRRVQLAPWASRISPFNIMHRRASRERAHHNALTACLSGRHRSYSPTVPPHPLRVSSRTSGRYHDPTATECGSTPCLIYPGRTDEQPF